MTKQGLQAGKRPIRDNLFVESSKEGGEPKLIGSRCTETGEYFFPAEAMSPTLKRPGTLETAEVNGAGKLVTSTIVRRGLPGFSSPYALGVVQLDAGPSIIAQLENWNDENLVPGTRVSLVIGEIKKEKDETSIIGPKFLIQTVEW